ncbi:hypothetical protein ACQ4PT_018753 [Festuca glaucescens]
MVGASSSSVVNVYPLANYTFGTKEPKMEKDTSVADRLARMKVNYMKEGMRTSVEAILLVQEHNHPHILLLQIGNTFCKLPGGRLKPGENEIDGLKRKLCSKLAVNSPSFPPNWQVGECVAVWWRPNFETVMYPYCPPHITKPKECKKLFIVHLTEREYFAVPRNLKLLAVPLFELYDNVQRYGPVISTIPQQLSRFQFNMVSSSTMELLPEDLLADILRRLSAHDLAAARCVHSSWRAVIDSHRLMQLVQLPLAGIFISFNDHAFSELLARPVPPSAKVSGKVHQYMPTTDPIPVADHCNGLLLLSCAYVANPATRRWATLRFPPPSFPISWTGFPRYDYIVFDPAMSPHYEVVTIPHLPNKGAKMVDARVDGWEWPPSSMMLPVFSSATNRWEERSFERQGEALGTVAEVRQPWPGDEQYGVYWRGHLYVHHNFIWRISLPSAKYRAIKPPDGIYTSDGQERRLGRSEKGVYLASIASSPGRRLRVWILDESYAHPKWVLKHQAELTHILSHRSCNPEARGSWVMEDVNYHFYSDRFPDYSGQAPPEDRFEWDFDNDDVLDMKDTTEGRYREGITILGFHPHKEVLFLSESMRRGLAYHLNASKLQDLGNMYPTRYDDFADPHRLISLAFPYTPCWTVEFPSNN